MILFRPFGMSHGRISYTTSWDTIPEPIVRQPSTVFQKSSPALRAKLAMPLRWVSPIIDGNLPAFG